MPAVLLHLACAYQSCGGHHGDPHIRNQACSVFVLTIFSRGPFSNEQLESVGLQLLPLCFYRTEKTMPFCVAPQTKLVEKDV